MMHKSTILQYKGGQIKLDNLAERDHTPLTPDTYLYGIGETESFHGYSGVAEFNSFPLRQIFINRHNSLASEWDVGYFKNKFIIDYINKKSKKILASHFYMNKAPKTCLLYLGGSENIYILINHRGYTEEPDKYQVSLLFSIKTNKVDKLMDFFLKNVIVQEKDTKSYINILTKDQRGFSLEKKEIMCPEIDFNLNYNEDFKPIHNLVVEKLSINNSKGLVLLHGNAGTGKTTYIRYLINNLKKNVIYIPPSFAEAITDPELIKFFMKNSNSVLVIEDAENILSKRVSGSSQAVSNVLNLTDGLLSDCANIQIVATFNTDILNIDSALLRKGRLIAKYEFKPLTEDRVLKLSKKIGVKITGDQTLADVYNSNEQSFINKKSKIGFSNNN